VSPLNARQRLAYRNRATIWRPRFDVNAGTKEQVEVEYVLVASDVPCLYVNNESPESVGAGGFPRYEQQNFFTRDSFHFAIDQEVGTAYLLQDTTTDRFGARSPHYGAYWLIVGEPQKFAALGGRNANFRRCLAIEQPNPPPHILG
jgi:hypothetical protein